MSKYCAIILLAIAIKRKKQKQNQRKKRRVWSEKFYMNRERIGHKQLLKELQFSSESVFKSNVRMSKKCFEELLAKVAPLIKKQDTLLRNAIPADQRLAVTLRYLASGNSFENLKCLTAIAPQTIGKVVVETCEAIIEVLKDYMVLPQSPEEWEAVAEEFNTKWNFPNCMGVADGKHIAIKKPSGSGSHYYNYKKFFSVVLTAVVNADYEFLIADVGINERTSDEEAFDHTPFGKAFYENSLNIPKPKVLPGGEQTLPYVFLGSEAFPLTENFMKPFEQSELTEEQKIFNYRLHRASRVAENAFGILSYRFGVFQGPINLAPEKVQTIVLACCYLHNFLRRKNQDQFLNGLVDIEDVKTGILLNGLWREESELTPLQITLTAEPTESAEYVRENFMDYFNNEGEVSWQDRIPM